MIKSRIRFLAQSVQCTTKNEVQIKSFWRAEKFWRLDRGKNPYFCHLKKSQRALGSSARPSPLAQHQNFRFKLGPFFLTVLKTQDSLCPLQRGATGGAFITFFHAEAAFKRRSSTSILASSVIIIIVSVVSTWWWCCARSIFSFLLMPGLQKKKILF